MRRVLPLLLFFLLTCTSPVDSNPTCDSPIISWSVAPDGTQVNYTDIGSEAELLAALRAGHSAFRLTKAIVITAPIYVDSFPVSSFFSLQSTPGYGNHIVRGFDGPAALFTFGDTRDWRIHLDGVAFEVPASMKYAGPSILVRHMFVSSWRNVMFEYHPNQPFVIMGGSAMSFFNLGLTSNGMDALLVDMADLAFFSGWIEDHTGKGTGLKAYATRDLDDRGERVQSPLVYMAVHQEFSKVTFDGFTRAHIVPGYSFHSQLVLKDIGCLL